MDVSEEGIKDNMLVKVKGRGDYPREEGGFKPTHYRDKDTNPETLFADLTATRRSPCK